MSSLSVTITSAQHESSASGARSITVKGHVSLSVTSGRTLTGLIRISVRIGINGPVVTALVGNNADWSCTGLPLAGAPPGSAITVTASATAQLKFQHTNGEPDIEDIASPSVNAGATVPGPFPPNLAVNPVASPIVTDALPANVTVTGTASGNDAPILTVQYAVEGWLDAPFTVVPTAQNSASWRIDLPAPPGTHTVHVKAYDQFGSAKDTTAGFEVARKTQPPPSPDGRTTWLGAPTTSSVTSWSRLEPQAHDTDLRDSSSARLFDPLWMMTRQWQLGEFQAQDAGTPARARVRATNALLTRCFAGALPAPPAGASSATVPGLPYDPARTPLEVLAERQRMRAADDGDLRMLGFAVEAGLHFLRLLELKALSKSYRAAFIARLALRMPTDDVAAALDAPTRRYLRSMAGRALDARQLAVQLRGAGAAQLVADPALGLAAADRPKAQQAAQEWLAWYDALASEPSASSTSTTGDAWDPQRLEYAMSVAARLSPLAQDDLTFTAAELDGSALDWSSFDLNRAATLGTVAGAGVTSVVEAVIPAPVSFPGAPAARFWELEDSQVAYGLVPVGPTDLAHLMMIEYAGSYGNDWFVVPLTLPVGSATRIDSLVVTDTFGVRSLLRPIGDPALPAPHFSMWQASLKQPAAGTDGIARNCLLLPSTLGRTLDGPPLEEVLFLRDEMANVAWAVERSVESPIEQARKREAAGDVADPNADAVGALPRYRLSTTVPANWIPLLPVQQPNPAAPSQVISRLQRAAVLAPDGTRRIQPAAGDVLNAANPLLLFDEEVPREGARITRQRRLARWSDGSTWLWTSLRNQVGSGEGSSGLRFDRVE